MCQFAALGIVTQSCVDILNVNSSSIDNYIRAKSSRSRVWCASASFTLLVFVFIWLYAIIERYALEPRTHNYFFASTCCSFALSTYLVYVSYRIYQRVASLRLVILSGGCFLSFFVVVCNSVYVRAHKGFFNSTADAIVYPWLIYVVPDLLPDIIIFACFVRTFVSEMSNERPEIVIIAHSDYLALEPQSVTPNNGS